jgi:peptidoglycan/LPS O-acetylase OafA/YrhL
MPHPPPDLLWAVHDRATSPSLEWLFWWLHGFRLPLFFLLAGLFAVVLHDSRGAWGYLTQRGQRLLVPLLAACVFLLPLTFGVWCSGWLLDGLCTLKEVRRMKFQPAIQAHLYGPAHLWFLEYLSLLCLLYAAGRFLASWRRGKSLFVKRSSDWLASPWRPLVLAVPAGVLLWVDPGVVCGFHNSFLPEPSHLLYYGLFFTTGVWLARRRHDLTGLIPSSSLYLLLSVPAFLATAFLLRPHLEGEPLTDPWGFAAAWSLFACLAMFGWLGLFIRLFSRESPALRYLADASYWIYLIHFPVVGLVQILLAQVPGPAAVKFLIVVVFAVAVGLGSYQRFVRYTFIGKVLHGARSRPVPIPSQARSMAA